MKRIFILATCGYLLTLSLNAQNIGIGTGVPHPSAVLDVSSNSKGTLITRMTTAQRKAIFKPAAGLLVFDLDKNAFYFYDGQHWRHMHFSGDNDLYPTPRFASDSSLGDHFGSSVSISGDYAVVGAWGDDISVNNNQGSAYVFIRHDGTWVQQTKITAADGATNDFFGNVSISGDYIIVGALGDDANRGAAYIFVRNGNSWTQQAKLKALDGTAGDLFGASVSISGDFAIVGAPNKNVGLNSDQGAAYMFVRNGISWSQITKVTAPDGLANDRFGYSVSLSGNYAVIGVPDNTIGVNPKQGSAYIFFQSGGTWTFQAKLAASDGAANDQFGYSVSISGDYVIAGAPYNSIPPSGSSQGSAYVFIRNGSSWTQQSIVLAPDGGSLDYAGYGVSISGDYIVVGATNDIGAGGNEGSVYIYKRNGTTWPFLRKAEELNGVDGNFFGRATAISGFNIIIGANHNSTGNNTGSISFLNIE